LGALHGYAIAQRILPGGARQILIVVLHDEVDKGSPRAIFRQALRSISETELRPHSYSER
jgi:hypothetical protein